MIIDFSYAAGVWLCFIIFDSSGEAADYVCDISRFCWPDRMFVTCTRSSAILGSLFILTDSIWDDPAACKVGRSVLEKPVAFTATSAIEFTLLGPGTYRSSLLLTCMVKLSILAEFLEFVMSSFFVFSPDSGVFRTLSGSSRSCPAFLTTVYLYGF